MSEYITHDRTGKTIGIVEKQFFTFAHPPDEIPLDSDARIGSVTLSYETCGKLNNDRFNAVLVLHALTGNSQVAGYYSENDQRPGWWDNMVY